MQHLKDIWNDIGDEKLKDNKTLAELEKFDKSGNFEEKLGVFKATLGVSGEASVSLINRNTEDEQANDPEGVFLAPRYKGDQAKVLNKLLDPHPVIPLPKKVAYLRYTLGVGFSGDAGADFDTIGLAIKSKISWQASYYSKHPFAKDGKATTIKDAFLADLGFDGGQPSPMNTMKSLFKADSVKEAKVGDIMTFSAAGNIGAAVKIDATELLAGSISVSGLFDKVIPVTYSVGFSADLSSSFNGDFFTAVAITGDDTLEVVVRRASNRLSDTKVNFGAQAKIDLSAATDIVNNYLKRIANTSGEVIEKLEAKIDKLLLSALDSVDFKKFFKSLMPEDAAILRKWYDTLIGKAKGEIDDLIDKKLETILEPLQKINAILKGWATALESYSEVAMSASLSYEMSKLKSTGDLLRFECDRADFEQYRKDLLLYRFDSITKAAQDPANAKVTIKRFLNATAIEKKTGSSFIVKIGDWSFGSSNSIKKVWVDLMDRRNPERPFVKHASFLGSREFESFLFKDKIKYRFSLEGAFKEDGVGSTRDPDISDLSFTLAAGISFHDNRLKKEDLYDILDFGLIGGALGRSGKFNSAEEISLDQLNGLRIGKSTEIDLGLTARSRGAKEIIAYLANISNAELALALSLAMYPWRDMAGRTKLSERVKAYSEVWEHVVRTAKDQDQSTKILLDKALDANAYLALQSEESEHWRKQNKTANYRRSLHGIITADRTRFSTVLKSFKGGISELDRQIKEVGYDNYLNLDELFEQIRRPWAREFSSRWILALLNIAAQKVLERGVSESDIQYNFQVKQGNTVILVNPNVLK